MTQRHGGDSMSDSILTSVKKKLGLDECIDSFDAEIIMLINAELATLAQLGVGPEEGIEIEGKDEKWSLIYTDPRFNFIPSYVALKVWPVFDSTLSASYINTINEQTAEYQWRLTVLVDTLAKEKLK